MSVIAIYHTLNIMNMNLDRNQTKRQEIKIPATFGPKKRERLKRKEEDKKVEDLKDFCKSEYIFCYPVTLFVSIRLWAQNFPCCTFHIFSFVCEFFLFFICLCNQ